VVKPPDRLPAPVRFAPWVLLGVLLILFAGTAWMPNTAPFPKFFASDRHQSQWAWKWNEFATAKLWGNQFDLWPRPEAPPPPPSVEEPAPTQPAPSNRRPTRR